MTHQNIWFAYLNIHKKRANRVLHYIATALLCLAVILSVLTKSYWLPVIALCLWCAIIIFCHSCIEASCGLFRQHPLLALLYCFRMSFSALTGHISEDLSDAVLTNRQTKPTRPHPPENW